MKLKLPDELGPFAAALEEELDRIRALRGAALTGGPVDYARFEEAVARSTEAMRAAAVAVVCTSPPAEPPPGAQVPERLPASSKPRTRRSPHR